MGKTADNERLIANLVLQHLGSASEGSGGVAT